MGFESNTLDASGLRGKDGRTRSSKRIKHSNRPAFVLLTDNAFGPSSGKSCAVPEPAVHWKAHVPRKRRRRRVGSISPGDVDQRKLM
jgi:hypothetical protein